MIKVKNKWINSDKIISLDYATKTVETGTKHWMVIVMDVINEPKIFFEIQSESEFQNIVNDVINQLKNLK